LQAPQVPDQFQTYLLANGGKRGPGPPFWLSRVSGKNWRARECRRPLTGAGCCEDRSDESFRRHGVIFINARVEDCYSLTVVGDVGSCVNPCAGATTATTRGARSGSTWNYAGFSRLVAPVRAYSAWPVAGCAISTAAASSTSGTCGHTHGTDVGKARARLGSIRSNADAD
jgi:hypothetical protein